VLPAVAPASELRSDLTRQEPYPTWAAYCSGSGESSSSFSAVSPSRDADIASIFGAQKSRVMLTISSGELLSSGGSLPIVVSAPMTDSAARGTGHDEVNLIPPGGEDSREFLAPRRDSVHKDTSGRPPRANPAADTRHNR